MISKKKITISVAESCTGGLLGAAITSVPGSSEYFFGGVVTYSNDSKENILKVQKSSMMMNGAVSKETAESMASGVRELFGTDIAISITGIAGPGGGTDVKPVGLVWMGVSTKDGNFAKKFNFKGNRDKIRSSAVDSALRLLIETINDLG
ncbi:putative competence-damage inducible protein [Candidatus Methanoplasma termitum]|uniref:CinA protein n=1 Tax=Candidatus Methanoplasma termitum TaxID=1577791 RepID=A0A0A7LD16_9ARCH|nr:putative competence-damage inducible protein [Candidatus Methanoplasma termitum]